MAERVEILKIEVDTQQTAQSLEQVEAELLSLTQARKDLTKEIKKAGGANKEQIKQLVAIDQSLRQQRKQRRVLIKDLDTTNNSLQAQRNQLAKLVAERNQLDRSTEAGAQAFAELNKEIKELNDSIKESEQAGGDFRRNVGNYAAAAKEAVSGIDGLGGALEGLNNVLKANIFVLIISSLVQLVRLFSQTEAGSRELEKATALLSGAFGALVRAVETFGKSVLEAFDDPAGTIESLGKSIQDNIQKRFDSLIKAGGALSSAFKALFEGDFEKAIESTKEFGGELFDATSLISRAQIEAAASGISDFADDVNEAAQAALNFAQAQQAVVQANQALAISVAQLSVEEQRLNEISADSTRSLQERTAANIAAQEAAESRAKAELQIARNNEAIIARELQQAKARSAAIQEQREIQQRLADATQERISAEGELASVQRANAQERRQLIQDELDLELDVLIDGLDNQKTINERRIADDKIALDERRALLAETRRLQDASFAEQIAIIQQQTKEQIDANELLSTSDARLLSERIKGLQLNEQARTRLLEIIREQRTATQDLDEADRDLDAEAVERRNRDLQARIDILEVQQQQETNTARQTEIERQQAVLQLEILNNELLAKEITYSEYAARRAEIEAGITNNERQQANKRKAIEKSVTDQKLAFNEAVISGSLALLKTFVGESAALNVVLGLADVGINLAKNLSANTLAAANISAQLGLPGVPIAAAYKAQADATALATAGLATANILAQNISAAAGGGDFVTSKPTLLLVGDNPGGRELVSVKPLSGKGQTRVAEGSGLNRVAMAGGGNLLFDGGLSTAQAAQPVNNQFAIEGAIKSAMMSMPSPIVSVQDINATQTKVRVKDTTATL